MLEKLMSFIRNFLGSFAKKKAGKTAKKAKKPVSRGKVKPKATAKKLIAEEKPKHATIKSKPKPAEKKIAPKPKPVKHKAAHRPIVQKPKIVLEKKPAKATTPKPRKAQVTAVKASKVVTAPKPKEKEIQITSPEIEQLKKEKEETARRFYVEKDVLSQAEKNYLTNKIRMLEGQIEREKAARIALERKKPTERIVRVVETRKPMERVIRIGPQRMQPERIERVAEYATPETYVAKADAKKDKFKAIMKEIKTQAIETEYDKIYEYVKKNPKAKVGQIAKDLGIKKENILEHLEALEDDGLVEVKYPPIGEPIVVVKKVKD